jgi:hypothetical protein
MPGFENRDARRVREFGGYSVAGSRDGASEDIESWTQVAN